MSEWKEYKFSDIAEVIGGGTPDTFNVSYWNGDIPWLTPKDLTGYSKIYISKGERNITSDGLKNSSAKLLPKDTVLLTTRAPIGYVAIAENEIATNQGFKNFVLKKDYADCKFVYYWLKNNIDYLRSIGTGTTFAEISGSVVKEIKILLPPLSEQKSIASILSSLDDKIDLLHRQNATLEKMGETLFRQWFVERRPEPVEGEAKEEWKEIKLGRIVDIINGVSYNSDDLNPSKTAMVTLKNFDRNGGFRMDGFKEYIGKYKKQHILKEGDLVVAQTDITQEAGVIGNPVMVIGNPKYDTLVFSMDLVKVISKDENYSNEFLYLLMKSRAFKEHCLGYSNGSTVLHLSKKAIPEYEMKLPSKNFINDFSIKIKPLVQKQYRNQTQIRTLTALRDTLLPKLMSGEIRVL